MASYCAQLLVFLAIGLQLYGATSWSFGPWSEPVVTMDYFYDNEATFNIMCQADVPLVKCQFKVEPTDYDYIYPIIDLSLGLASGVMTKDNFTNPSKILEIRYNGTGLENGQCGATFRAEGITLFESCYHFGCRGADKAGEWHDMDFPRVYHLSGHVSSSIEPRQAIVKPGSNVSFLLQANPRIRLRSCAVTLKGPAKLYVEYYNGRPGKIQPKHFSHYGSPLEGECGVTVLNVTETDNGPVVHTGWSRYGDNMIRRTSLLIVAAPPTETFFNVHKFEYSVGDTLEATCSSLLSRPVANLTWTLDDRIIRQDGIDDEFQEDVWIWPWDKKNITQRMSIKLEEEHFGKKLECTIQHMAFTKNISYPNYLMKYNKSSRGISWLVITVSIMVIILILSPLLVFKSHYYTWYLYLKSFVNYRNFV